MGVVHAKGSLEVALPLPLQKNSADAKATFADNDDVAPQQVSHSSICYSAVVKVKGINMMIIPSLPRALGDDRSDDDAICEAPQPLRGCRRVNSSPWAGNNPKQAWGALCRK